MADKAQIIDVFAGPGGLGEGFSAYKDENDNYPFEIKISVEMERFAHKTLRLRAFLRYFKQKTPDLPQIYIDYIAGKNSLLGKLLEFREAAETKECGTILSENESSNKTLIQPEYYCPKEFKKAKKQYESEWANIELAISKALNEAKRMTLGPDELAIHEAIDERIDRDKPKILIGGPPCQAFSMVGRSRRKGKVTSHVKEYDDKGNGQWNQDDDGRTWLYREYIKIIHHLEPDIFVMENVRGMMSAKVNDADGNKVHVWKQIFADLSNPAKTIGAIEEQLHYDIYSLASKSSFKGDMSELDKLDSHSFVLHAEKYGVPQNRERVILMGIKKNISSQLSDDFDTFLTPLKSNEVTTVLDAIGDLPALRAGLGCLESYTQDKAGYHTTRTNVRNDEESCAWSGELKTKLEHTLSSLNNSSSIQHRKVGRVFSVSLDTHSEHLKKDRKIEFVNGQQVLSTLDSLLKYKKIPGTRLEKNENRDNEQVVNLKSWYGNSLKPQYVLNHETRAHMDSDLCRYRYSAAYSLVQAEPDQRSFPRLPELEEVNLDPKGHKNRQSFIDRYRTQILNWPATTVTSHLSKDGHYFIHPDPSQMRSMTVREVARIQTFPDDYFFEGPRTAQYVQVGNAVPPLLANKIAAIVHRIFQSENAVKEVAGQLTLDLHESDYESHINKPIMETVASTPSV